MAITPAPAAVPCLLTDQGGGYYAGTPGSLSLMIRNVIGTTQFNTVKSMVWDVTDTSNPISVQRTCTAISLTFTIVAGKTYHVQLECIQVTSPYEAQATLNEGCGAVLATIDVVNQMPGLMVTA